MLTLTDGREKLYQWDTDVFATVEDESINEVHFSHLWYGENYNIEVKDGIVRIPDEVLQNGADICAWAYIATENGGVTKRDCTLTVIKRPKPNDYVYTSTERKGFESLQKQIGDLANLDTQAKGNLVEAINEAITSGGGASPETIAKLVEEYLAENPPKVEEKDPTVPEWAKAKEKPTYTASEVGALSQGELQSGVDKALQQAKESGEFDGDDYTLTDADRQDIADRVLADLPELPSGDEKWEVINEIELTENIQRIDISLDSSGNPFALKRVYAVFNIKACTTEGGAFSNAYEDITGQPTINGQNLFYVSTILTVGNFKYKSAMEAELITNDNILVGKCYDLLGYTSANKINQWIKSNPNLPNGITKVGATITKTNGMLAAGSTIKIWGIRL